MTRLKAADMTLKERMKVRRQDESMLDPSVRAKTFDEVNLGFNEDTFSPEILRCIKCKKARCSPRCPLNNDMSKYIDLLVNGKVEEAIAVLTETNPMPAILGRICPHFCESNCIRTKKTDAVRVHAIERYLGDIDRKLKNEGKLPRPTPPEGVELGKVAVIGAGPAGLTCAYDLAKLGYKATIFEASKVPGGMLFLGIPEYRLPRDVIDDFMKDIDSLGIKIEYETPLSNERTADSLLEQGFDVVFVAIGAYKGLTMNIPGEGDFEGFLDCIDFLRQVNLGDQTKPGDKVIVIGGGNSAIDAARTALRLGCEDVNIVYRRTRAEMPANDEEIEDADAEGVKIHYLASPVRILGEDGMVVGMELLRCELGEPDSSGRRRPEPIAGSEFVISADVIIPAISQRPDISFLTGDHGFEISRWDSFVVDEETMSTNKKAVFAGGDAVTGPETVVTAVAAGQKAARSIHEFLSK